MTDYVKAQQMMDIAAYLTMFNGMEAEKNKMALIGKKNDRAIITKPVALHNPEGQLLGFIIRDEEGQWSFTQDPL